MSIMPRGDLLWQRLQDAYPAELQKLGEIMGLADVNDKAPAVLVEELSVATRAAAGHSLRNLFRGPHDFPYKQILIDVTDKMAPGWTPWSWTHYKLSDRHSEEEKRGHGMRSNSTAERPHFVFRLASPERSFYAQIQPVRLENVLSSLSPG